MSENNNELDLFEEELNEISLINEKELKKKKILKKKSFEKILIEKNLIEKESVENPVKLSELKNKLFPVKEPKKIQVIEKLKKNEINLNQKINSKTNFSINSFIPLILIFAGIVFLLLIGFLIFSFFNSFISGNEINAIEFTSIPEPIKEPEPLIEEKKPCPFECCSPRIYLEKKCIPPLICSNNECILPPCTKECCEEEGIELKKCSNGLECVNNECLKPECPFMCCMASDKEYREKKCISGLRCLGRVCSIPVG
jgi:hypothetical protein